MTLFFSNVVICWETFECPNYRIHFQFYRLKPTIATCVFLNTLPETNIAHENPIFPGKYHQNDGFSMAMLVSGRVNILFCFSSVSTFQSFYLEVKFEG